jgi:hypothetical protein
MEAKAITLEMGTEGQVTLSPVGASIEGTDDNSDVESKDSADHDDYKTGNVSSQVPLDVYDSDKENEIEDNDDHVHFTTEIYSNQSYNRGSSKKVRTSKSSKTKSNSVKATKDSTSADTVTEISRQREEIAAIIEQQKGLLSQQQNQLEQLQVQYEDQQTLLMKEKEEMQALEIEIEELRPRLAAAVAAAAGDDEDQDGELIAETAHSLAMGEVGKDITAALQGGLYTMLDHEKQVLEKAEKERKEKQEVQEMAEKQLAEQKTSTATKSIEIELFKVNVSEVDRLVLSRALCQLPQDRANINELIGNMTSLLCPSAEKMI